MNAIEKQVLAQITPGQLPRSVEQTRKQIKNALLGGSTAKNTHLHDDYDIDFFVRFPKGTTHIADKLQQQLKKHNVQRVHGSRDYFQLKKGPHTFEIVPVLAISTAAEAENVTDVSPLHVTYVQQHMTPALAASVRLTKQFCKAAKVYGAESYIGGFSGYVLELLNIYYGGFRQVLEAAATWKHQTVIDPGKHKTILNKAKTYAPLTVIDPVQPDRNSAAALTQEAFVTFKNAARAYMKKPQKKFFTITPLSSNGMPGTILHVTLLPLKGKHDVIGAKCQKVFEYCKKRLEPFHLLASAWEFTETATLFYAVKPGRLPAEEERLGPPLTHKAAVQHFKEKHAHTYTKNGRIYAKETRTLRDAKTYLAQLLTHKYVRDRVQCATLS